MVGVAVVTACVVNINPRKNIAEPSTPVAAATDAPTILNEKNTICVGDSPQKIVTNLPAGMRYAISTEYINPTTVDTRKIVPSAFTALDYLESNGRQFVDTGFVANSGMRVQYAAKWKELKNYSDSDNVDFFFGAANYMVGSARQSSTGHWFYNAATVATFSSGRISWSLSVNGTVKGFSYGTTLDQKYTVDFATFDNVQYLMVDGKNLYSNKSNYYAHVNYPVYLFSYNGDHARRNNRLTTVGQLYYATIWDGSDKLVRDLVPVRHNASGVYGFYDTLNKKNYLNHGTGTFIPGPEVNTNAAFRNLTWLSDVNDHANNTSSLSAGNYYVYYYTPTSNGGVKATPLKYTSFTVQNHNYGAWQTTKVASCTTAGERQKTCGLCGNVVKESIPAIGTHTFGSWVTVSTTGTAALQRRTCTRCSQIEERSIAPYRHQITIKSSSDNRLVFSVTVYGTQATVFTIQDWVSYLNSVTNPEYIACSGTVRYYVPDTRQWYTVAVTKINKYDNNSFAYYYTKGDTFVNAVTTLSHLTISDTISAV